MVYIDLTKLCNWAKGIAKWAPRLNGPYNPNLIVPQLWLCKMGIMPPCHHKMTAEINLPIFVKSLNPKLWVSFPPRLGKENELFQAVLVASQHSYPARNAFLLYFFRPASRWRWLWARASERSSLEPGYPPNVRLHSAAQKLPANRRHTWRIKAHFHDSVWCSMSDHTHLLKKHCHRPRTGQGSPEMVTCSASFPYSNKGEPITAASWLSSFGILNFALLAKQYCSNSYIIFSTGFGHKLLIATLLTSITQPQQLVCFSITLHFIRLESTF